MKYYTGVGSRETPSAIQGKMRKIARQLELKHYCLRSGAADGADAAFESGVINKQQLTEIYLPWREYNGSRSELILDNLENAAEAYKLALDHHPVPNRLGLGGLKLMARNSYQLLGKDLNTPSEFLICWTPNGQHIGGTAQAIRLAMHNEIPVYNLALKEDCSKLEELL